jgi:hypothetical protein
MIAIRKPGVVNQSSAEADQKNAEKLKVHSKRKRNDVCQENKAVKSQTDFDTWKCGITENELKPIGKIEKRECC